MDEKINIMKRQAGDFSLNIECLDGGDLSLETLSAAVNSSPLLGGEKLVIVRNPKITPENQEIYLTLIKNMPPGIKLVFAARTADKRTKFYRYIEEKGEVREFKTFAPWEQRALTEWIIDRAGKSGKSISEEGARVLQETCGNNLRVLSSEIEKLATFIGERGEIGEDEVKRLASPGEINAFALLDALREKNIKQSLSLFQNLLKNKEDPFQLLSLLATQYRLMLQIKSLDGKESDPKRIAGIVHGSPYFVKKCMEKIDAFTTKELKEDMENLLEANLKMKTGEPPAVIFELLLTSLCPACSEGVPPRYIGVRGRPAGSGTIGAGKN
ncbi:DNA polymerase III subunit delta [Candidatus Saganbacteria bacterium]|uniref:DNA-directed DNA polymerase n=1 Tax=Candidatus Saganbacteria bacterium TaxID=2575572 RepID=A0A9D6UMD1_UNCSA|nr:DNA polymerase III subunit delta [Candidatus Saganbacteria bacterium]